MQIFYPDKHRQQNPAAELSGGVLIPVCECPERAEQVLRRVHETGQEA